MTKIVEYLSSAISFISKNSTAVLIVAVVVLSNSTFRLCQRSVEMKSQIETLQKQRDETIKIYSNIIAEQKRISEEVDKKMMQIEEKYKDKQQEMIDGIKELKNEYMLDESKVIEFLVKFDIVGGSK